MKFTDVADQLAKQGAVILPHQYRAFAELDRVGQVSGALFQDAALGFTKAWRETPKPVALPKNIFQDAKATVLEQPDEVTCQSTSIAMVLGFPASQIYPIRKHLEKMGTPGDPAVMGKYLTAQLGDRYQYHNAANINEILRWLGDGELLIVHGQQTASGHVFVLDGVQYPADGMPAVNQNEPYGEFDFPSWRYVEGTRFYDGWISVKALYAVSVIWGSAQDCHRVYLNGELDMDRGGAWVHRIKPVSTAKRLIGVKANKISPAGLAFIKSFEGLRLTAYCCSSGVWSIGWGTTVYPNGRRVKSGDSTTAELAEKYYQHDVRRFEELVNQAVTVPLTQHQFDAVHSFAYNVGEENFKSSTLLRLLNQSDYVGAAKQFGRWINDINGPSEGLKRRRKGEAKIFSGD